MRKLIRLILMGLIIHTGLFGDFTLKANQTTLSAQMDFLFMHYREVFRDSTQSKKKLTALFGMGEYYFLMSDSTHAQECFRLFLKDSKNNSQKLFAYSYLLKIAELNQDKKLKKELSKELMAFQKNIFVFRNSKQYKFNSPLKRLHKAVCSIDKVEFYVEGKSFAKITL